jgi:hypothetical protein
MVCRGRGGGRSRPPLRDRRPRAWPGSSRRGRRRSWGVMNGPRPICRFVRPSATRASTSASRRVRPSDAAGDGGASGEADLSTRSSSRRRRPRPARASRSVPRWTMAPIRWASRSPTGSWRRYRCATRLARRVELHRAPYRRITVRDQPCGAGTLNEHHRVGEVGAHEGLDDLVVPPSQPSRCRTPSSTAASSRGGMLLLPGVLDCRPSPASAGTTRRPAASRAAVRPPPKYHRHLKCWSVGLKATIDEHVPTRRLNA